MYTLHGKINGVPYAVTFEDGRLTGDDLPIMLAQSYAEASEGTPVGVPTRYTERDHLTDPVSAYVILTEEVFDEGVKVTGKVDIEGLPPGAVG